MTKVWKLFFTLALATGVAQYLCAQDTTSGSSTPASQTIAANNSAQDDGVLTQQLQSRFGQDPEFANVQVSVSKGTANITGSVPAKADKKRAKELAKSISGVKHVKEQLTVNPSSGTSTKSSGSNNPTDASLGSSSNSTTSNQPASTPSTTATSGEAQNETSSASSATATPGNGQTSATSINPNSQASTNTGAPASAAASPAAGENASSAPQNAGSANSENNLAGKSPSSAQAANTSTQKPATSATQPPLGSSAIGSNAGAAPSAPGGSSSETTSINDTATLQRQIQDALQNEPTLRNDNLNVSVTDSTIELSGSVQNGREKETARRIASSFAGNRRVKDRTTLSGKGAVSNPGASTNPSTTPTSNPQTNNNPNSQNPSANSPAANGDASANPR